MGMLNTLKLLLVSGLLVSGGLLIGSWLDPGEISMADIGINSSTSMMNYSLTDVKSQNIKTAAHEVDIKLLNAGLNASFSKLNSKNTRVNADHLDHLFEEIELNGEAVGIIHIYCEYPDYKWVGDDDEGIACVDDASRAAVFYLRNYTYTGNQASLRKAKLLLNFLINMQAENGYFYNFIWPDHSIHTEGVTTKAEPNWWSWRTLWTYGEAIEALDQNDELVLRIKKSREKLLKVMLNDMSDSEKIDIEDGIEVSTWLPARVAADQASVMMIGLAAVYRETGDSIIGNYLRRLAEGVMIAQVKDTTSFADRAFLSWNNLWHAYGNSQAYALQLVGRALSNEEMLVSASLEGDRFYESLLTKGGLSHFKVRKTDAGIEVYEEAKFQQIAYNYRPMIWACLESWKQNGQQLYLDRAIEIASWYTGSNPAGQIMYDSETGRTFDGIVSETEVNRNSGAESTIEALLALQELNRYTSER